MITRPCLTKIDRMKRIILTVAASVIALFSAVTVFSKPNPNASSILFNKSQYKVESYGTDPGASPEVIQARMEALNTQVEMAYNSTVQDYIDAYLKRGRAGFSKLLVLSAYYMPIFESALQEAGLPDELKYLPMIESGLKAEATSCKGAGGLWQFMPSAAKDYDMHITASIDERCDPYISSKGACRLLSKLFERYGDWHLALAAYNAGPGTVNNAIRRAGGGHQTFWTVANYLPAETRKYVPKFIAMTYVMNYYTEHNIPRISRDNALPTDTVHVHHKMSLRQVAGMVGVDHEQLRTLNPHFRSDVIPGSYGRHCNIILPADKVKEFKNKQGLPFDDNRRTVQMAARENAPAAQVMDRAANGEQSYKVLMNGSSKRPQIDPNRFRRKDNSDNKE